MYIDRYLEITSHALSNGVWLYTFDEMTERQIDVKGMNINFQSSRGHIERWGEEHGKTIKVGDLIGWEDAESQSCPFHILLVSKEKYSVGSKHGVETITPWDGGSRKFEQGTQVSGCKRLCKDDTAETTTTGMEMRQILY